MKDGISVLVSGRTKGAVETMEGMLKGQPGLEVRSRVVTNGFLDPLHGVSPLPKILILHLGAAWLDELRALSLRPSGERPQTIVVGPERNAQVMRTAMQSGARDFFTDPVAVEEMLASVRRVAHEIASGGKASRGHITAVMNAKGGSGASFIATNLSHMLAKEMRLRVALLDLDLQFGTLYQYLDLTPHESLLAALSNAHHIDAVALEGYMSKHPSGVHLLSAASEQTPLPWEIPGQALHQLLDHAVQAYQHAVLDLPRQIDPLTTHALERADRILLVLQQGVSHLRDGQHLVRILTKELLIPPAQIHVIVNRYDKKQPIGVEEIRAALNPRVLLCLPNDYERAAEAINLGTPLLESGTGAPITRAMMEIAVKISGVEGAPKGRGLRATLSQLLAR